MRLPGRWTTTPGLVLALCILLGCPDYGFIVNPGIDHISPCDMGFILLHLLNGAFMLMKVLYCCKTLDLLLHQVTIGHGVPNGYYLKSFFHKDLYNSS